MQSTLRTHPDLLWEKTSRDFFDAVFDATRNADGTLRDFQMVIDMIKSWASPPDELHAHSLQAADDRKWCRNASRSPKIGSRPKSR